MTDLANAEWRKSSLSGSGNNCVEVTLNLPGVVAVRDSKDAQGAPLIFTPAEWRTFVSGVKRGDFE
ncbi:DUF397 domain-containing protein [Sphaerisporangium sp. NPDC088356]|uniref:DUF397 domain-containing protein n=1 Tax=Sphaerisporangium sp. NPDC088356 TaxID=3154871 RepID=UPI0034172FD3